MIRTVSILSAVALGLVAMPAAAASEAFVAGAAAYDAALASDVRPSEKSDFAYCSGYWGVWATAVFDESIPERELEALDIAVKVPSAQGMAIAMFIELGDESAEANAQVEMAEAEASQLIKEALGGSSDAAESLFRSLGTCQVED